MFNIFKIIPFLVVFSGAAYAQEASEAVQEPSPTKTEEVAEDTAEKAVPLTEEEIRQLDEVFTFYYLAPSPEKVGRLLDMINTTDILRDKPAHAPISSFLSRVFLDNTEYVYGWMARNDYNTYAQDVIANALVNAGLKRDAVIFAEAHGWKDRALAALEAAEAEYDFERMGIYSPGHVDVLWALFSATGDTSYIGRIIDYLNYPLPLDSASEKTKKIAELTAKHVAWTLYSNAGRHEAVRKFLALRIAGETNEETRKMLKDIIDSDSVTGGQGAGKSIAPKKE